MTPEDGILALVARYPRVGAVKTRLAASIGSDPVYALYCAFLRDLADRLGSGPWRLHWLYTPATEPFATWLDTGQATSPQQGETLNERLLNGFRTLCQRASRVAIMSTDSPHVPASWIARAFALLDSADVVLGPCDDGGYYLIAMREPHDVFQGISMSTPGVLADTLALAQQQHLTTALLPATFDVDDQQGLAELVAWLADRPADQLQRTRAVLARLPAGELLTSSLRALVDSPPVSDT